MTLNLDGFNEPQPDLCVVRGRWTDYLKRKPEMPDVLFLLEVCESTHFNDLTRKVAAYGRAGLPEYRVLDLKENRLLRHCNPRIGTPEGGYDGPEILPSEASVTIRVGEMTLPTVTVAALLGLNDALIVPDP